MKYLVVYDSIFGNTEKIAQAVGQALAAVGEGQVIKVGDFKAETLAGLDLVVAGSPTRGFRPTPALKDFLKGLPAGTLRGVRASAFDTRMRDEDMRSGFLKFMVGIFGYAAQPIANLLAGKGASVIQPLGGFFVAGAEGPLLDGEIEKAREWAARIAAGL